LSHSIFTPEPGPAAPVVAADHEDHGGHDSPEHIRREMRGYLIVLGALGILTGLTVWARQGLHLPMHYTIMVALVIASFKGFLVAGFFMHLLSEKKLIYSILALTVIFFGLLIWLPLHDIADKIGR
jgi:cytochrome c oxidase subunit 4